MSKTGKVSISVEMTTDQFSRFKELLKDSGIIDPEHLFEVAMDLLEKAANARLQGHHIGSVPQDAEAGRNGIVEILMSREILVYEVAKASGATFQ